MFSKMKSRASKRVPWYYLGHVTCHLTQLMLFCYHSTKPNPPIEIKLLFGPLFNGQKHFNGPGVRYRSNHVIT